MAQTLPGQGSNVLEVGIIIVFGILFGGIAIGFWLSFFGLINSLSGPDKWAISRYLYEDETPGKPRRQIDISNSRTAILMPICQEDIMRVMAGLESIYRSLEKTGELAHYEFFILSDSRSPDLWIDEEAAWAAFVEKLDAAGRLHYRRRRVNLKRKSGNVADFCRRWGNDFDFMLVLDADSVMAGQTIVDLTRLMVLRPEVGLIQTVPQGVMKSSPLARLQQFCGRAYGPIFAAGLHWLLLGGAIFWGHNAIIRIKPFMEHCGLPRLAGLAPLGGDIMSHDFVESALLKRAGWDVWLAYDLDGSYEEVPPTLLDELKRDQRWCQGNLQHLKLIWAKGMPLNQRLLFVNGAFSYLSSFFWFMALMLSTFAAVLVGTMPHDYFAQGGLFPQWPTWTPQWALILLCITAVFLFAPKFMAIINLIAKGELKSFGGAGRLFLGVFIETIFSTLAAPVRMLFHSKVIFFTFLGRSVGWNSQDRNDRAVSFKDALRFHLKGALFAIVWALIVIRTNTSFAPWLSPIWIALILAPLLTVVSSLPSLGKFLMRWGLWRIPVESSPPRELTMVDELVENPGLKTSPFDGLPGFRRVLVDPKICALHLSLLGKNRSLEEAIRLRRRMLLVRLLDHGPREPLTVKNKVELLSDAVLLAELHAAIWELPEEKFAIWLK